MFLIVRIFVIFPVHTYTHTRNLCTQVCMYADKPKFCMCSFPHYLIQMLRRALLVTPRAFCVTLQNPLNMQKAARFMQRAAFSFIRFSRRSQLRIVDHLHLRIGEVERFHVLHLFDLCVNHRFKRRRIEPDSVLAENLLRIRQLLVAIACAV